MARLLSTVALLLASLAPISASPVLAITPSGGPVVTEAHVEKSPFSPDGDGIRENAFLYLTLDRTGSVTVSIRSFDGKPIRTLVSAQTKAAGTWRFAWNGRDSGDAIVRDGPYGFVVSVTDPADAGVPAESLDLGVAKAAVVPYPAAPASIVVSFTAGHGGPTSIGAAYDGLDEKDINLDISLRLRDMLEASGIVVSIGRITDTAVNEPPVDVNGDGDVGSCFVEHGRNVCYDELIARNDIANLARADLFLSMHNNGSTCHCVRGTSMYTSSRRTWTPEGVALAHALQDAHMSVLSEFTSPAWSPTDRGVNFGRYVAMKPYELPKLPRPTLMPAILSESTFGDHPIEGALLQKRKFRTAIAVAFYEGITEWLIERAYGLRYEVVDAPGAPVPAGSTVDYDFELTNTGNASSSGWTLEARYVPAVSLFDGSPNPGTLLGSVPIPDGFGAGATIQLAIDDVPVPPEGDWLIKFDVVAPGDETLGFHGVVGPQLPLTVTAP